MYPKSPLILFLIVCINLQVHRILMKTQYGEKRNQIGMCSGFTWYKLGLNPQVWTVIVSQTGYTPLEIKLLVVYLDDMDEFVFIK